MRPYSFDSETSAPVAQPSFFRPQLLLGTPPPKSNWCPTTNSMRAKSLGPPTSLTKSRPTSLTKSLTIRSTTMRRTRRRRTTTGPTLQPSSMHYLCQRNRRSRTPPKISRSFSVVPLASSKQNSGLLIASIIDTNISVRIADHWRPSACPPSPRTRPTGPDTLSWRWLLLRLLQ